jgi:RNA 2',3'-cyclic 3'-phosphodiesterase
VLEFIDPFAEGDGHARRHNLFFALCPSPAEAARLHGLGLRLRRDAGLAGSVTSADRLHVSLHGLGEHRALPKRLVDAACEAGERLVFPRFVVTFDCAGSFRGGRGGKWPFVLRSVHEIDALTLFHRALAMAMTHAGLRHFVATQFTPHMTLLYDRRFQRPRNIDAVCFVVRELVLVSSLTGQGRHVRIGRWPLRS